MAMVLRRDYAREMHETAIASPQCGAAQRLIASLMPPADTSFRSRAIALSALGVVSVLALFDGRVRHTDTVVELGMFALAGLSPGMVSINKERSGNGIAIAGIVLAALSFLALFGLVN